MAKKSIREIDVTGKRCLVRVDFNMPLDERDGRMVITDDTRIRETLPTIHYLTEHGAKVLDLPLDMLEALDTNKEHVFSIKAEIMAWLEAKGWSEDVRHQMSSLRCRRRARSSVSMQPVLRTVIPVLRKARESFRDMQGSAASPRDNGEGSATKWNCSIVDEPYDFRLATTPPIPDAIFPLWEDNNFLRLTQVTVI